jgi:hypothetical protein
VQEHPEFLPDGRGERTEVAASLAPRVDPGGDYARVVDVEVERPAEALHEAHGAGGRALHVVTAGHPALPGEEHPEELSQDLPGEGAG